VADRLTPFELAQLAAPVYAALMEMEANRNAAAPPDSRKTMPSGEMAGIAAHIGYDIYRSAAALVEKYPN
jgi:hypothetical protein